MSIILISPTRGQLSHENMKPLLVLTEAKIAAWIGPILEGETLHQTLRDSQKHSSVSKIL